MPTIQLDFDRHITLNKAQHKILLERYKTWRKRMGIANTDYDVEFIDWLKTNLSVARAVVLGEIEK